MQGAISAASVARDRSLSSRIELDLEATQAVTFLWINKSGSAFRREFLKVAWELLQEQWWQNRYNPQSLPF
jgi:hypothetical protein